MQNYGDRAVVELGFDFALAATVKALQEEGYTQIEPLDVGTLFRQALGRDFRRYTLLRALHPDLFHRALSADLDIGVVLAASLAIYELADGETVIAVADPLDGLPAGRAWREERPDLFGLGLESAERLGRVLRAVTRTARAAAA